MQSRREGHGFRHSPTLTPQFTNTRGEVLSLAYQVMQGSCSRIDGGREWSLGQGAQTGNAVRGRVSARDGAER